MPTEMGIWRSEDGHAATGISRCQNRRADWNGRDWFVSFGEYGNGRSWDDGLRFGFVSAGGGAWYSGSLRTLPVGARVNVFIPKRGYVAIGETLAEAERFDVAEVLVDGSWVRLADQKLTGRYRHTHGTEPETDEIAEYAVPVRWLDAVQRLEAYWQKGMFANQNSACKLRQELTLNLLVQHFEVEEYAD